MIDGQSSGVNTSQIKKEKESLTKSHDKAIWQMGTSNGFNVPRFKILYKNGHSSLSVFESAVTTG